MQGGHKQYGSHLIETVSNNNRRRSLNIKLNKHKTNEKTQTRKHTSVTRSFSSRAVTQRVTMNPDGKVTHQVGPV
jgi:hypothetical protein